MEFKKFIENLAKSLNGKVDSVFHIEFAVTVQYDLGYTGTFSLDESGNNWVCAIYQEDNHITTHVSLIPNVPNAKNMIRILEWAAGIYSAFVDKEAKEERENVFGYYELTEDVNLQWHWYDVIDGDYFVLPTEKPELFSAGTIFHCHADGQVFCKKYTGGYLYVPPEKLKFLTKRMEDVEDRNVIFGD